MQWLYPLWLLAIVPLWGILIWADARTRLRFEDWQKRSILVLHCLSVACGMMALAQPAKWTEAQVQQVYVLVDVSQSVGVKGLEQADAWLQQLNSNLDSTAKLKILRFAERVKWDATWNANWLTEAKAWQQQFGTQSRYDLALQQLLRQLPVDEEATVYVLGDAVTSVEVDDVLLATLKKRHIALHTLAINGEPREEAWIELWEANQARITLGATLELKALVKSTVSNRFELCVYEDGVMIAKQSLQFTAGESREIRVPYTPQSQNLHRYRVELLNVERDQILENNQAELLVEVRGGLRVLHVDRDFQAGEIFRQRMQQEGILIEWRNPQNLGVRAQDYQAYDLIILANVEAHQLPEGCMVVLQDYVDRLGGGLLMTGNSQSFGLGGYADTPIEKLLPVKLRATDQEEKQNSALALVIDRSGSMEGEKMEMAKRAAQATAELLGPQDFIGVFAFDSAAHQVVPMTRVTQLAAVQAQIRSLTTGGGTHMYPALMEARAQLSRANSKIKHMIVLSDGQTQGTGYEKLVAECRAEGMTLSTVAIGEGAHVNLLNSLASMGGGKAYVTTDVNQVLRIFTQDTLLHTGQMIREEAFQPVVNDADHTMISGMFKESVPPLLGYVKTAIKPLAQTPLLTDQGEPLLAFWRFGLGKVTAFTSDTQSRWSSLWMQQWSDYAKFWSQILRHTARQMQSPYVDLSAQSQYGAWNITLQWQHPDGTSRNQENVKLQVDAANAVTQVETPIVLKPVGPGRYEALWQRKTRGQFLLRMDAFGERASVLVNHLPAQELENGVIRAEILQKWARSSGGDTLTLADEILVPAHKRLQYYELWPWCLLCAMLLLCAEMLIKRWYSLKGLLVG